MTQILAPMNDLTLLTHEDITTITNCLARCLKNGHTKIWDEEELAPIKQKIKAHFRIVLDEQCCYCRKGFDGEFNFVIDIEHILPKAKYLQYALSPFNLTVACKRCNMKVKRQDVSFLKDPSLANVDPENVDNYKFIHPNLEDYFTHLKFEVSVINNVKVIKYTVQASSLKGQYTYEYFKLKELEVNKINAAQGIAVKTYKYSDLLPKEQIEEIELLLTELKSI
jgi:hypothetical protein